MRVAGLYAASVVARLRGAGCVFAEDEAALLIAEAPQEQLENWVARRVEGEPLEQIVGWAEFAELRIAVEPGVFVPRRRTELLVGEALAVLTDMTRRKVPHRHTSRQQHEVHRPGRPVVVDLCCGSGAVGVAIARQVDVELHAVDIEPAAVRCARRNIAVLLDAHRCPEGVTAASGCIVHLGDLDDALPESLRGKVSVLVANAPYVPADEIERLPPEARDHEPRVALHGGSDGLDLHRRIAALAPRWLSPGGSLLIETSRRQASATAATMIVAGLEVRVVRDEDVDGTAVVGVLPRAVPVT